MRGRVFVFIYIDMPKVALQFLADFKSIFSHLTNIFGPNAISHASNTYITFEIKSVCVFC
jgi:hypothetical protein